MNSSSTDPRRSDDCSEAFAPEARESPLAARGNVAGAPNELQERSPTATTDPAEGRAEAFIAGSDPRAKHRRRGIMNVGGDVV